MAESREEGGQLALRPDAYIELAPSENHVSARMLEALARKCAGGCSGVTACAQCQAARIDECVAIDRVKKLFGAAYANVLPHSVSQAVEVVHKALLAHGETVLKVYTGDIDYDKLRALAQAHKPRIISARFPEACRVLNFSTLRAIADQIGAYLHIDTGHVAGLIAAGLYPNPVAIADVVTAATDGTLRGPPGGVILARSNPELEVRIGATVIAEVIRDPGKTRIAAKAQALKEALDAGFIAYQCQVIANTRAMLEVFLARGYKMTGDGGHDASFVVELSGRSMGGEAAARLKQVRIHVAGDNQNPPASGAIRMGASAITTRGFKLADAKALTLLICDVLDQSGDPAMVTRVRKAVSQLCKRFPVQA